MADGKWITDLKPTTPLANAARHVLTVRLEVVRRYLPLAVHEAAKDLEYVHQLRVGTRRAGAALRIFVDCLPDKVFRDARRHLRQIRRAAGAARDGDVFLVELDRWTEQQKRKLRPGLDFLTGLAMARRQAAQADLVAAAGDSPFSFDRFAAETVAAVHRPHVAQLRRLRDLARPTLTSLLNELENAAATDLNDYGNLHQVRITGKRLRYAMEVFVDCFTAAFREELYPAVEEMQEILGIANDSRVAGRQLGALRDWLKSARPDDWQRYCPAIEGLLRFHEDRLPEQRKCFVAWWQRWQNADVFASLTRLLRSAPARTP